MNTADGTYFDGQVTRPLPVTVEFADMVRIWGESVAQEVALTDITASDRIGNVPRFLYLPGGGVVETPDNDAVDVALATLHRGRGARVIHALESRLWIALAGCVVLVVAIAGLSWYGPPLLARAVARRVPAAVDQRIGQVALQALRPYLAPTTLSVAEQVRVNRQLARLEADPSVPRAHIEFRQLGRGLANAFALPGNVILVTDALVRLPATDDELAAVLAHELGHLALRHGDQDLLRKSFALLLVAAVTGDMSTLTSYAGTIPMTILTAGYSRDLEHQADEYAYHLLRARGINPHAFATVLVKLDASLPPGARVATYLNTHPATEDRITLFGGVSPAERTTLLAQRWVDLAAAARNRRDLAAAIEDYSHALKIAPTAETYALRADSRFHAGEPSTAMADADEALKLDPKDARALVVRVEVLAFETRHYDDAIAAASRGLTQLPENGALLALRGYAELEKSALAPATADLNRAVTVAPTEVRGWSYRGVLRQRRHDTVGALADFDHALKMSPGMQWVRLDRAALRSAQHDYAGALADFDAINDPAFQTAAYYFDRGVAERHLNATEHAIADFTAVIVRKVPTIMRTNALRHRAALYLETGQYAACVTDCGAAIDLDPKFGPTYFERARAEDVLAETAAALRDLDMAATHGVPQSVVLRQRTDVLMLGGDYPAAIATIDRLLEISPDAMLFENRGMAEYAVGQWRRADGDLGTALALMPAGVGKEYAEIYRVLIDRRAGQSDATAAFAAQVANWPEDWTKRVGQYLSGQIDAAALRAAEYDGDGPAATERQCEADFYIGFTRLLRGDTTTAARLFRACRATGVTGYFEYRLSGAELKRLGAGP